MTRHEATFDIEDRSDARAVRRLTERIHDAFREELGAVYDEEEAPVDALDAFETIRNAARDQSPGTLKVVYETDDDGTFEN
jgi:hypothetical protein